ncbi:hypothetical protein QMZ92_02705 [Streptomyces sp. HNM0645]|uniref:hypothetical protein n=1 Tax=Streptomyces sp. HNM0645 TaxID=2782343 RepID=UPI0024B7497B|nr:hypothetical protein [Streptomyces sp. HNM0645]MDI9883341.1 hypothetical protein [Streptomyces sp. HNM0645]
MTETTETTKTAGSSAAVAAPAGVTPDALRRQVALLAEDMVGGRWAPSPLERRIAELLILAAAGDGQLTETRIRAAFWEGSCSFLQDNGGRLAALLGDLLPHVSGTVPAPQETLTAAHALLTRTADHRGGE